MRVQWFLRLCLHQHWQPAFHGFMRQHLEPQVSSAGLARCRRSRDTWRGSLVNKYVLRYWRRHCRYDLPSELRWSSTVTVAVQFCLTALLQFSLRFYTVAAHDKVVIAVAGVFTCHSVVQVAIVFYFRRYEQVPNHRNLWGGLICPQWSQAGPQWLSGKCTGRL